MTFWSHGRAFGFVLLPRNALSFTLDDRWGSESKVVLNEWILLAKHPNIFFYLMILYPTEYSHRLLDYALPLQVPFKNLAEMQSRKKTTVITLEPTAIRSQYSKLQYSFK